LKIGKVDRCQVIFARSSKNKATISLWDDHHAQAVRCLAASDTNVRKHPNSGLNDEETHIMLFLKLLHFLCEQLDINVITKNPQKEFQQQTQYSQHKAF
jgi:hypothetical protein